VNARVNLAADETPDRGFVYEAVFPERGDERSSDTGKKSSHKEVSLNLRIYEFTNLRIYEFIEGLNRHQFVKSKFVNP